MWENIPLWDNMFLLRCFSNPFSVSKVSLKINMMVKHLKESNKNWKIMTKSMIRCYLKSKFKCSIYMANQAIEKLYEDE